MDIGLFTNFVATMNNAAMNTVYKFCCNEHCVHIFCFQFSWANLGVEMLGHMVTYYFDKSPNCFPKHLNHFTFPRVRYEGSDFSTSLPMLSTVHF